MAHGETLGGALPDRAPMTDRSSHPPRSPNKTPDWVAARMVSLRLRLREGPVQLAARTGGVSDGLCQWWSPALKDIDCDYER